MRVAAVQAMPVVLDLDASLDKAVGLIADAAAQGAELVVFPEAFLSLYPVLRLGAPAGRRRGRASGSGSGTARSRCPGRPSSAWWRLREHDVVCAIGVNERELGGPGRSTTPCSSWAPTGLLSRHRKLMPTFHERLFHGFGAGDDLAVADTRVGRSAG